MPSKIEWTDRTWNPVRGCSRVSNGCSNCYAERIAHRFQGQWIKDGPGTKFVQIANGHPQWTGKVELIESKLQEPLHWRKPQRVFVNSMSDLLHEALPFTEIARVVRIMREANWHTYQILTKRAARLLQFWNWWNWQITDPPLPRNTWWGVSIENQATADERIPLLRRTPAAVRFVSYKPALGPVDFTELRGVDWLIVGGESGPAARPAHPDWFRSARDQCQAARVPFFFKQWGEHVPITRTDGGPPGAQQMIRVGKRAAGRMLDGREWSEFPKRGSRNQMAAGSSAERS